MILIEIIPDTNHHRAHDFDGDDIEFNQFTFGNLSSTIATKANQKMQIWMQTNRSIRNCI